MGILFFRNGRWGASPMTVRWLRSFVVVSQLSAISNDEVDVGFHVVKRLSEKFTAPRLLRWADG